MARMRATIIQRWGDDGIQINFELVQPAEGAATNHTEMANPKNPVEFKRLLAVKLFDEIDIIDEKVVATT